jgi:cyclic beta-1,2-glucan synthetase
MLDAASGVLLEPIRSEIFGVARFEQHGRSLGESHRAGAARWGQATFYPRLQSNVRSLRAAYQYIAVDVHEGHDISPSAEWLLDNFHLIEDQLREIREGLPARYYRSLPVLQDAPLVGLPRIYGVAWAFVAHTDSAFDENLLVRFLDAYQGARELSQGELWALPTTLRVVLVENLRRLADRIASHKAASELASLCAGRIDAMTLDEVMSMRALMVMRGVGDVFLSHLAQSLAGHGSVEAGSPMEKVRRWLQETVPDMVELQTRRHASEAADHLSVGNAVTALRLMGAADWSDIVGRTSRVVRVMRLSPVFEAEDEATRDITLHEIERLSSRSGLAQAAVARTLLDLMEGASGSAAQAGFWLRGRGRARLERSIGLIRPLGSLWRTFSGVSRIPIYLGLMLTLTVLLVAWLLWAFSRGEGGYNGTLITVLVALAMLIPASEVVVAVTNRLIGESVKPVHLPRLLLAEGIPSHARVMVVVPTLLNTRGGIEQVVHRLHLHHLGNPEACTQFALLSDWCDADTENRPEDLGLLEHAQDLLTRLNLQHPVAPGIPPRFLLLHRMRSLCPTQGQWLGWERKRGKLEQLATALATGQSGPFLELGDLSHMAAHTRYILSLDSDTHLPPGRLRALVGVAEHPDNQPRLDESGTRVVQGYGILQPRVVPPLPGRAACTAWQWISGGSAGLDPYSAMSSDVYQDLFGEGSFTGKGLMHVATLHAVLGGRLPTGQVLSHDLLEGALVRCAVVTDVTLIESDPDHADAAASRLHRWIRGDWQLLPFLLRHRRWPLGAINRWKLFDNLRRSLVAPACLLMLVLSMIGLGPSLTVALALTLAAHAAGPLMGALAGALPARWAFVGSRHLLNVSMDVLRALATALWHLALLPRQTVLATDAVLRTLFRLGFSRRHLLEWITADEAQAGLATGFWPTVRRHRAGPMLALGLAVLFWWLTSAPGALTIALIALWTLAPLLVWMGNTRTLPRQPVLKLADRDWLNGVARDTWRLFERSVDADNHHLPPDNLQTSPYEMVAHRTSPTNIGLYLLSAACARSFGWIGTQELLERLEATFATLVQMERHHGHFLNWYDTRNLKPLLPRYVSTVDSGNLGVHLLALAQACIELSRDPHDAQASHEALRLSRQRLRPRQGLIQTLLHRPLSQTAIGQLLEAPVPPPGNAAACAGFHALIQQARDELAVLTQGRHMAIVQPVITPQDELTWLLGDHLATLHSAMRDTAAVAAGCCDRAGQRLLDLAVAFEDLAWAPDFRFLFSARRRLLHIGYAVEEQQLDSSFYDLLASESRSTSLLAIAKGDIPVRHWASLGRPFFASGRHAAMRSWSGSMFEYLMPQLVMVEPQGSALREAGRSALQEQMNHLRGTPMPWGMSESAYAGQDHTLAYQYAPQGVPRLALRRTPGSERVIAPYATVLAAMVDARLACDNLRRLAGMSARGRYGFLEALDFTPARQVQGGRCTLVHTFMAHHQGMSVVALANVLHEGVAQRWGMTHPRMEAVTSLLHERAPRDLPPLHDPLRLSLSTPQRRSQDHIRTIVPGAQALEPTHLMGNGRYSVTLRANGAGWSRWGQTGITRWRDDALRDACGHFLYLREGLEGAPSSLTRHPAPDPSAHYTSRFHADRVSFDALWPELSAHTTAWVSPEDDVELRRVVLTNLGQAPVELELISAFEVTLASHAADEAHPAFSNLFVKAEWLPAHQALYFERVARLQTEPSMHMAHFVAESEGTVTGLRCQTDRLQWLGRHHTAGQPLATMRPVPAVTGPMDTGLDPVSALGVRVHIEPGAQACVTFAIAATDDAALLHAVVDKYRQSSYVARSSVMSATLAGIPLAPHRPRTDYLPALQALTTALVLMLPRWDALAAGLAEPASCRSDRRLLWPLGISGERPLVLVHAGAAKGLGLLRVMVLLLHEWSRAGVACDLVVLTREPHSHHMPLQRAFEMLREQHAANLTQRAGQPVTGLYLLRVDELSVGQISSLRSLARVQLEADGQALLHQVRAWCDRHESGESPSWRGMPGQAEPVPVRLGKLAPAQAEGTFADGNGAFAFEVSAMRAPQRPWCNVLANPGFGCLLTEGGGGNTWAINSRLNQLTAWSNDPVGDPPSEHYLLQDRRTREIWSLTPSAWGSEGVSYQVVHAQGVSTISHWRGELVVSASWSVDAENAVKQVRIRLENQGTQRMHLRVVGMVEWMMGEKRADRASLLSQPVSANATTAGVTGLLCTRTEAAGGWGGGTAFYCASGDGAEDVESMDWTCDRQAFFDCDGQLVLPHRLGKRSGFALDPCAALSRPLTLRAGAVLELDFLLGYAPDPEAALGLMRLARLTPASVREQAALARWDDLLGRTRIRTPDPLLDGLVNRWLIYQTVSSRLWAKAGFYQAGGATGYRDQLQDAMALVWADPAILRSQIVLCASRQFEAGDVQHWWHAPGGAGVRTHFSDDLLWLPYATMHYLRATGDHALLEQSVQFLDGAAVPEGAEDRYDTPGTSAEAASIYEHGARAIDRSLPVGAHGLPLMGSGDWNDGMNRVGSGGRGESVWLAWFLCVIVRDWLPLARARGERDRASAWEAALAGWRVALNSQAWDGAWFKRAFFDDGSPLGSSTQDEACIDLIAQAWAVLSEETSAERQRQVMDAVETLLVDPDRGLIRLLTPPLVHARPSAGYIQSYPPGVRENGGQYAHAGVWALMAAAEVALQAPVHAFARNTPYRYFTYLSPAHRSTHPEWGKVYGLEPYAMAADVYSQSPYSGRGGWSWYTGAAGWLHRAAVESILGLHLQAEELWFTPCLPVHWPRAEINLTRGGRSMHFLMVRTGHVATPLASLPGEVGPKALTLQVGERLRWRDLPPHSRFVISLPALR